jgi:hypothetical protein
MSERAKIFRGSDAISGEQAEGPASAAGPKKLVGALLSTAGQSEFKLV